MNIPDKIITVTVNSVVVIVPALVGTKFFVGAAMDLCSTVETFPFHSTKVLIKIQKNVFKRL